MIKRRVQDAWDDSPEIATFAASGFQINSLLLAIYKRLIENRQYMGTLQRCRGQGNRGTAQTNFEGL